MSILSKINYKIDEKEKALIELHQHYSSVMRLIYLEMEEKGYAFVKKKTLREKAGTTGQYRLLLQLLRKVFTLETTKNSKYIIVFPIEGMEKMWNESARLSQGEYRSKISAAVRSSDFEKTFEKTQG